MRATLYAVPGSHPSLAAELMLRHKGVDVTRVDLVSALHRVVVRALGFPDVTVPALKLDGVRLQGSRRISRALDAVAPEPPLFPRDAERRAAVEQAEAWGDSVLQPAARRLAWAALERDSSGIESYLEGARLGLPTSLAARTSAPVIWAAARLNRANEDAARRDLAVLPGMLDRVDRLVDEGVLGGGEPNAADFQIATSVALLGTFEDLRPLLDDRPAARLASQVVPRFPGRTRAGAFPAGWLPVRA